jgi:alcohol dehydrogenase class IV
MKGPFELATAVKIRFGDGVAAELPEIAARFGERVLFVTGSDAARHMKLLEALWERAEATVFSIGGEPSVREVEHGLDAARDFGADVVVSVGGGSAIDAGKAIAALMTNGGRPLDYLEVIGAGKKIERASAPFIAVPTTSGTGAEVTKNAVLGSKEHAVKVSLRSDFMLPDVALVDPELTRSVPPAVTASTGLDALTQVLEPYVSNARNPLVDPLCRDGLARAARSLRRAYENGADADARRDMSLVSLFGGLALANAKLGAVHGFAGPIGGMVESPHGAVCARLLPAVVAANVRALRARAPDPELLARYDEIARILTGRPDARADDAIAWIEELVRALSIPPLSRYGLGAAQAAEVVDKASRASSMKGNPIELTRAELHEVLERAM